MAFLDSFKKRETLYILVLAAGVVIVLLNNLLQFVNYLLASRWLNLLSLILYLCTIIYIIQHKEEVLK